MASVIINAEDVCNACGEAISGIRPDPGRSIDQDRAHYRSIEKIRNIRRLAKLSEKYITIDHDDFALIGEYLEAIIKN